LSLGSRGTREKEQSLKGDKKIIEYLNKALRHELTAEVGREPAVT
jgi:hypothetical protein